MPQRAVGGLKVAANPVRKGAAKAQRLIGREGVSRALGKGGALGKAQALVVFQQAGQQALGIEEEVGVLAAAEGGDLVERGERAVRRGAEAAVEVPEGVGLRQLERPWSCALQPGAQEAQLGLVESRCPLRRLGRLRRRAGSTGLHARASRWIARTPVLEL